MDALVTMAGSTAPELAVTAGEIAALEAAPATGKVTVGGVTLDAATGKLATGQLAPSNEPLALPGDLASIVRPADEVLDLAFLDEHFNPFRTEPEGPDGKPLFGGYTAAQQVYDAKIFMPLRKTVTELATAKLGPDAGKLAEHLSEYLAFRTPAHRFKLPSGEIGNRVVFYGGNIGHAHLDHLIATMRAGNMRLLRACLHLSTACSVDNGSQGGSPEDVAQGKDSGVSHLGGHSRYWQTALRGCTTMSDWPPMQDLDVQYNAHFLAIDYSKGAHDEIPADTLNAYCLNADMWDCIAGILVPFATHGELDPRFAQSYSFNPLDVYDQRSVAAVARDLASLDRDRFLIEHGAFYCAEGQYSVANLGPQEATLIKRSTFGNTPLAKLIDKFGDGGWMRLLKDGDITEEQYATLEATGRLCVPLMWIDEEIKGWQAYRPRDPEGLVARPMSIATLTWSLFRRLLPREAMAEAISGEILRLYGTMPALQALIKMLLGGREPHERIGRGALSLVANRLATEMLARALASETNKQLILNQAGINEIPLESDKQIMRDAYDATLQVLREHAHAPQEELDKALLTADQKLARLSLGREHLDKRLVMQLNLLKTALQAIERIKALPEAERTERDRQLLGEEAEAVAMLADLSKKPLFSVRPGTMMLYAAPMSFVAWAQQPFLAGTECIRYVATAMHVLQSLDLKPDIPARAAPRASAGIRRADDTLDGKAWRIAGQLFMPKEHSTDCLAWIASVPPGAAMPSLRHLTQDKFIFVLDGELTVTIDGVERTAGPADLVTLPRGSVHGYVNRGTKPSHATMWVSPSRKAWSLFEALDGKTDPAAVAEALAGREVVMIS